MREVASILDGIDDMVEKTPFDIHNGIVISPVASVSKFAALLVRLGCTVNMNNLINALQHNNNPLNFFGGYLLYGANLNCGTFIYNNKIYKTELSTDEDNITSVKYVPSNSAPMDINIDNKYMLNSLTIACEMVKDFQSRQIFK